MTGHDRRTHHKQTPARRKCFASPFGKASAVRRWPWGRSLALSPAPAVLAVVRCGDGHGSDRHHRSGRTDRRHWPDRVCQPVRAAVNQYRVQQALTEWPLDETLVAITLDHSRLIAQHARLGNDGFDGRFQRVRSQLCVETLATGFSRAQAVVAWRQLPTHHANLREPKVRRRSAPIRPVAPGQTRAR